MDDRKFNEVIDDPRNRDLFNCLFGDSLTDAVYEPVIINGEYYLRRIYGGDELFCGLYSR